MRDSDLRWLTDVAVLAVGRIAAELAKEASDQTTSFFQLSVCLCIFAKEVLYSDSEDDRTRQSKIHAVLEEVENALTFLQWPKRKNPEQLQTLRKIAQPNERDNRKSFLRKLLRKRSQRDAIRRSLRKYVASNPMLDVLLKRTREFSTMDVDNVKHGESFGSYSVLAAQWDEIPVFPQRVNAELYAVLDTHINCCTCSHSTRLRLKPREMQANDMICFEVLFSASTHLLRSTGHIDWRETRIFIPRKGPHKKHVTFLDSDSHSSSQPTPRRSFTIIRPGRFCELLKPEHGLIPCLQIDNESLGKLNGDEFPPPGIEVEPGESIPLSNALRLRKMTLRNKCILAFTLARSVWQYYESEWMELPWTHEDIHLLDDRTTLPTDVDDPRRTWRPYLSISFDKQGPTIQEYCNAESVMHRYPKVLALGILLIEILQGSTVVPQSGSFSFDRKGINELYKLGWLAVSNGIFEREDAYPAYAYAVENCLDNKFFTGVPYPSEADGGLEQRKALLYQGVVFPLKRLLEGTGWSGTLDEIKHEPLPHSIGMPSTFQLATEQYSTSEEASGKGTPAQPSLSNGFPNSDEPDSGANFLGQTKTSSPESWLKRFEHISGYMKETAKNGPPVKIAVLDTGCDLNEPVFKLPGIRESITSRWKDTAGTEKTPIDEDPGKHGTRLVSVLLRIAPHAEIFVARVASKRKELGKSSQNVANVSSPNKALGKSLSPTQAIIHAARKWNVDIISMSFGFEQEFNNIQRAINEALDIKDQSLIFLAAAGNDGANSAELFPASMDPVISIRGTDCTGRFVSSLDPSQKRINKGKRAYGTLGERVPHAWPEDDPSKTMTGCSIATPIAAAIVALIINCGADFSDEDQKLIRRRDAILDVFERISTEDLQNRFYLAPWRLFKTEDTNYRSSILTIAIRELPTRV